MIRIQFGKHVLASDANGWVIFELRTVATGKRKGEVDDVPLGYFGRLPQALSALLDRRLRESEATTVAQLAAELKVFREELACLLEVPA